MYDKSTLGEIVVTEDQSLTLKHPEHGEQYHSQLGARKEAEGLYIERSGFVDCLHDRYAIKVLDVGLGLAYNAMCTIERWSCHEDPPDLWITSLEINHSLITALMSRQAPWTVGWPSAWIERGARLQKVDNTTYQAKIAHKNGKASGTWVILVGDAAQAQLGRGEACQHGFDFVWQDPFSPAKNPALWSSEWFARVATVSASHVILMTYSVARTVRDNLTQAGWVCEKIPTIGQKRHWLKASLSQIAGGR